MRGSSSAASEGRKISVIVFALELALPFWIYSSSNRLALLSCSLQLAFGVVVFAFWVLFLWRCRPFVEGGLFVLGVLDIAILLRGRGFARLRGVCE